MRVELADCENVLLREAAEQFEKVAVAAVNLLLGANDSKVWDVVAESLPAGWMDLEKNAPEDAVLRKVLVLPRPETT